jgi:tetratricopeptide (TPR) repeat protein
MYLKAKEKVLNAQSAASGHQEKPIRDALSLLEKAVELDPNFTTAYCLMAYTHDALDLVWDPSSTRHTLGDQAINNALRLQPDLPEVRLAHAHHLYRSLRDYERAREELATARRGLPNSAEADYLEALMDRRQGKFESATHYFNEAIKLDPHNSLPLSDLAETLSNTRQFEAAERAWDQLVARVPDASMAKARKEYYVNVVKTGDDTVYRRQLESLSTSMSDDKLVLAELLNLALGRRDWQQAKQLLDKVRGQDGLLFRYGDIAAPADCYSILLARLQGQVPDEQVGSETRRLLNQKVKASPTNAILLSNLAVVEALLGHKDDAIAEGEHAVELLPVSKDAVDGPLVAMNLAVVYAWTDHPDLAFQQLDILSKIPYGLFYNHLKLEPYFDPLREDPRYDKLLAALASH